MPPLIVGSNLDSLGRNSLIAEQQAQDPGRFNQQMLLNQMIANQQDRQRQQENAIRQDAINKDMAYRNSLLAQQDRQWNTPNATAIEDTRARMAVAKLPWTLGETPAERSRNALLKSQIDANKEIAMRPVQTGPFAQANAQMLLDNQQARERRARVLAIANAQIASQPHYWFSSDEGQGKSVIEGLKAMYPEAGELVFDPKNWKFIMPDVPQASDQPQTQTQPQSQSQITGGNQLFQASSDSSRTNSVPQVVWPQPGQSVSTRSVYDPATRKFTIVN